MAASPGELPGRQCQGRSALACHDSICPCWSCSGRSARCGVAMNVPLTVLRVGNIRGTVGPRAPTCLAGPGMPAFSDGSSSVPSLRIVVACHLFGPLLPHDRLRTRIDAEYSKCRSVQGAPIVAVAIAAFRDDAPMVEMFLPGGSGFQIAPFSRSS